jgi:predicted outer membrane protein
MRNLHGWRGLVVLAGALVLAPLAGQAQQGSEDIQRVRKAATEKLGYVQKLIAFDEAQLALGKLGLQRSDNVRVHALAQNMVDQSSKHLDDLGTWAHSRSQELQSMSKMQTSQGVGGSGVDTGLANASDQLEMLSKRVGQHRAVLGEDQRSLQQASGAQFDRDWLDAVKDTQKDAKSLVKDGIDRYSDDSSLATLLNRSLPGLEQSLKTVEQLEQRVK